MCLAVPHRIEELRGDGSAIATAGPIRRSIRVDALPGAQVGDLVLVHAGFAIEKVRVEDAADLGAGEIVVNSVDADGTRAGFELTITKLIAEAVPVPVVASGGAGKPSHLADAFHLARADAAIVAGMVHTGEWTIAQIKEELAAAGIPVRKVW